MADDERKNDLLAKLSELDAQEQDIEATLRTGLEQSVQSRDVGRRIKKFVSTLRTDKQFPPNAWDALESGIHNRLEAVRITKAQLSEFNLFNGTSQAVVTASSTATAYFVAAPFPAGLALKVRQQATTPPSETNWTADQISALENLQDGLRTTFAYKDWLPEITTLIEKLGASDSHHPGTESAVEHLRKAQFAYEQPPGGVTSPVAVLVELRSGVNTLLERLRRRLTRQQPGNRIRERVVNLGEQAGYHVFGPSYFEGLGRDLALLAEDLDDAKAAKMTREEIRDVLNNVLYALRAVLSSVDPARLKPK